MIFNIIHFNWFQKFYMWQVLPNFYWVLRSCSKIFSIVRKLDMINFEMVVSFLWKILKKQIFFFLNSNFICDFISLISCFFPSYIFRKIILLRFDFLITYKFFKNFQSFFFFSNCNFDYSLNWFSLIFINKNIFTKILN